MAGSSSSGGRMYGATFRASGPSYPQEPSQFVHSTQYQYASNQTAPQQWPSQQPVQPQHRNDYGFSTSETYAQPTSTYSQPSPSLQYPTFGLQTSSYQTPPSVQTPGNSAYTSQSWPFRPTPTEGYQTDPRSSIVTASLAAQQSVVDPAEISTSQVGTSWHQGSRHPQPPTVQPARQAAEQASSRAVAASPDNREASQIATGHKRKRTTEHDRRPAPTSRESDARVDQSQPEQDGHQAPLHSISTFSSGRRTTHQTSRTSRAHGTAAETPFRAPGAADSTSVDSTDSQPTNGLGPRAAWALPPAYGRKRGPKGNWLPRDAVDPSQNNASTGVNEPATENLDGLLTSDQISALQRASGTEQSPARARTSTQSQARGEVSRQNVVERPGDTENTLNADANDEDVDEPNFDDRPATPPEQVTSADGFSRKNMHLPPVVGSYLHYSNMTVKYNPMFDGIDDVRLKLFELKQPVLLNSQQIASYWSHMTNVWMRSTREQAKPEGAWVEAWECRHRKRVTAKHKSKEGRGAWQSKRQLLKESTPCPMRIRMAYYIRHADTDENHNGGIFMCQCLPEWMYLEKSPKCKGDTVHNHDIDMLDRFKRSDAMMFFVKNKAEEGYAYSAVTHWLHDKYNSVTRQAQYVGKQEVANVSQKWRKANRHVELRMIIEEHSAEEVKKKKCLDLIHSATTEGATGALLAVCKRLPEAIAIALPLLEALQDQGLSEDASTNALLEGDKIVVPPPGLPDKIREKTPPPPPPPKQASSSRSAASMESSGLRWQAPRIGQPSPMGPHPIQHGLSLTGPVPVPGGPPASVPREGQAMHSRGVPPQHQGVEVQAGYANYGRPPQSHPSWQGPYVPQSAVDANPRPWAQQPAGQQYYGPPPQAPTNSAPPVSTIPGHHGESGTLPYTPSHGAINRTFAAGAPYAPAGHSAQHGINQPHGAPDRLPSWLQPLATQDNDTSSIDPQLEDQPKAAVKKQLEAELDS
ncbi:hypothetical protein LTR56_002232 [Elasticomyces elasticus]|nr:hypothetical protein LTR56_002232 [Elasticomyces elasticus]KAK3666109.1 hypothetical protein LTR22_003115 [Elasticomyces elasticus]KAK4929596.1 hypothetical protein LTR49_003894 [Elasticomyces elasticus]KAK5767447.1 hypothetical protein LTS12_002285 [Elasticomyces elasticus]